jgi:hypothetical protein
VWECPRLTCIKIKGLQVVIRNERADLIRKKLRDLGRSSLKVLILWAQENVRGTCDQVRVRLASEFRCLHAFASILGNPCEWLRALACHSHFYKIYASVHSSYLV